MKKNAPIQEELNNLLVNYPNNIASDDIIDIFDKLQKDVEEEYGDTYINIAVQGTNIVRWNHTDDVNIFIDIIITHNSIYPNRYFYTFAWIEYLNFCLFIFIISN